MSKTTALSVAILISCSSGTLWAQLPPEGSECGENTIAGYLDSILRDQKTKEVEDKKATVEKEVDEAATGVSADASGFGSGVENFLPILELAGLAESESDDDGNLVIDFNFWKSDPDGPNQAKLRAILANEPSIYEPLKQAIPEDVQDAQTTTLNSGLGASDDYSLELEYNLYSQRLGRKSAQSRALFSGLSFLALRSQQVISEEEELRDKIFAKLWSVIPQTGNSPDNPSCVPFDALNLGVGTEQLKLVLQSIADNELAIENVSEQALIDAGLHRFGELMDNQPQLHFSIKQTERDELVGPSQTSIKASYEYGLTNITRFLKENEVECEDVFSEKCLNAYTKYTTNRDIAAKHRLSISAEYVDIEDYTVALPNISVSGEEFIFMEPGSSKLTASGTYGRSLKPFLSGAKDSRLDVRVTYENPEAESMNERFVFSATITHAMGPKGEFQVPIGLVYANKPEFLGEVDSELSAHVGLTYDFSGLFGQ